MVHQVWRWRQYKSTQNWRLTFIHLILIFRHPIIKASLLAHLLLTWWLGKYLFFLMCCFVQLIVGFVKVPRLLLSSWSKALLKAHGSQSILAKPDLLEIVSNKKEAKVPINHGSSPTMVVKFKEIILQVIIHWQAGVLRPLLLGQCWGTQSNTGISGVALTSNTILWVKTGGKKWWVWDAYIRQEVWGRDLS